MSSETDLSSTDQSFVHVSEERLIESDGGGEVECDASVDTVIDSSNVEVVNLDNVDVEHSSNGRNSEGVSSKEGIPSNADVPTASGERRAQLRC